MDSLEGDLGLIFGDFNTTLNPFLDQHGYVTDPHKKVEPLVPNGLTTGKYLMQSDISTLPLLFFPGEQKPGEKG